jgi:prepilin peptidase CpaA
MAAEFLVLFFLPALLAVAAAWDVASYTIPNVIPFCILVAFAAFVFAAGMSPADAGTHLLAGLLGLVLGFALFATGLIGGGDAKLFAAVLVWFGLKGIVEYALIASLFGGALTLGLISLRSVPLPASFTRRRWIARLHDQKAGIPYGVALALGAFAVLPYTEVFHVAAVV